MKLNLNNLTKGEQHTVSQMANGPYLMLTVQMAERLKELGWAEQKLGGTGLSKAGREAYLQSIAYGRRF
jgi:hypothetical protein